MVDKIIYRRFGIAELRFSRNFRKINDNRSFSTPTNFENC